MFYSCFHFVNIYVRKVVFTFLLCVPLTCLSQISPLDTLPNFKLYDLEGRVVELDEFKGKVLVIDFWATWCAPCIKSFPALLALEQKYSSNDKLVFLYVNTLELTGRDESYIVEFLRKKELDFTVYLDKPDLDQKNLSELLQINSLPFKMIVNESGIVSYLESGFSGDSLEFSSSLNAKIKSLL